MQNLTLLPYYLVPHEVRGSKYYYKTTVVIEKEFTIPANMTNFLELGKFDFTPDAYSVLEIGISDTGYSGTDNIYDIVLRFDMLGEEKQYIQPHFSGVIEKIQISLPLLRNATEKIIISGQNKSTYSRTVHVYCVAALYVKTFQDSLMEHTEDSLGSMVIEEEFVCNQNTASFKIKLPQIPNTRLALRSLNLLGSEIDKWEKIFLYIENSSKLHKSANYQIENIQISGQRTLVLPPIEIYPPELTIFLKDKRTGSVSPITISIVFEIEIFKK